MMVVPDWFWLAMLFSFGLAFGSFANVVIWRFPREESLSRPPSHCPACEHPIRVRDNVPLLSWVLLRGRCRDCGVRISSRYPAVELLSGSLWLLAGLSFDSRPATIVAVYLFYVLLILTFIDLDVLRLPNGLVLWLGLGGLVAVVVSQVSGVGFAPLTPVGSGLFSNPLLAAATGSVTAGGLSLGIAALYSGLRGRSGLGMGDVKLLVALGPFLGVYTVLVLFIGSVIGAVVGIAVAARRGEGLGAKIPFGPFLAIAAIVVAIAGVPLVDWYLGIVTGGR
jgi:leader peptidase (prepilin peptidase)/N-methyltransferase